MSLRSGVIQGTIGKSNTPSRIVIKKLLGGDHDADNIPISLVSSVLQPSKDNNDELSIIY